MTSILYLFSAGKGLRLIIRYSLIVIAFCAQAQEAENEDDLYSQIQSLQSRMNIQISGLEKIGNEQKVRAGGSLDQQLRQALESYNHIITQNNKGQIEKVVIINKKQNPDIGRIVLPTRYQDGHFLVAVSVSGNGRFWVTLDMLIDTGADFIVLPESMIEGLGMADETFIPMKVQTANGEVNAKVGKLHEVKIAGDTLVNVDAAFIDDRLLGNNNLLGMSALGRYKLIIDNQSQSITLFKK
jgi:clan AA aspartic protease (TIGR02281 family)